MLSIIILQVYQIKAVLQDCIFVPFQFILLFSKGHKARQINLPHWYLVGYCVTEVLHLIYLENVDKDNPSFHPSFVNAPTFWLTENNPKFMEYLPEMVPSDMCPSIQLNFTFSLLLLVLSLPSLFSLSYLSDLLPPPICHHHLSLPSLVPTVLDFNLNKAISL